MAVVSCEIVSANERIFTGSVKMLVVTGSAGELGIMPGHAALLSDLKPGPVRIVKEDDSEEVYYLSGGYVEVQPNSIAVLADTAIRADSIDEASAAEAVAESTQPIGHRNLRHPTQSFSGPINAKNIGGHITTTRRKILHIQ